MPYHGGPPGADESLALAATGGAALPDFIWAARSGADPRGVHGNARALVELAEDFEDRFLALALERHYVYGDEGFPGHTGKVMPDLPIPTCSEPGVSASTWCRVWDTR